MVNVKLALAFTDRALYARAIALFQPIYERFEALLPKAAQKEPALRPLVEVGCQMGSESLLDKDGCLSYFRFAPPPQMAGASSSFPARARWRAARRSRPISSSSWGRTGGG